MPSNELESNSMNAFHRVVVSFIVGAGVALSACASETPAEDDAPLALNDAIDPRDEGTSYNGWTQFADAYYDQCASLYGVRSILTRSSGDWTRGGGVCFVMPMGESCSSDSTCLTSAQSMYGSSAWGYCYSGSCYGRPGSQGTYCTLNPDRSSGSTLNKNDLPWIPMNGAALGCMTKTAGPNTACGGTNTSLYMRTLASGVGIFWC
jgi:hypothetical protein